MDEKAINNTIGRVNKLQKTRKIIAQFPHQSYSIDLVDMIDIIKHYDVETEYRYVMNCIDVFSRKAFISFLPSKNTNDLLNGFKDILAQTEHIPNIIWTDQEPGIKSSIFKKFLEKNDIKNFNSFGVVKNPMVESFNRTEKIMNMKLMDTTKNYNYTETLPDIIEEYNQKNHSAFDKKYSPNFAEKEENTNLISSILLKNYYHTPSRSYKKRNIKNEELTIGDIVNVVLRKHIFGKETDKRIIEGEKYKIIGINNTNPPTYRLQYLKTSENVIGSFYVDELRKNIIKKLSTFQVNKGYKVNNDVNNDDDEEVKPQIKKGITMKELRDNFTINELKKWLSDNKINIDKKLSKKIQIINYILKQL